MPQLFKETDDIIRLGKYLFFKIPSGSRCKRCPLSAYTEDWRGKTYCCELRPSLALSHDEDGPFKDSACPRPPEGEE
jgi:hypothetical protein